MAGRWARWIREPLVVFAGVAAALFVVDAALSPGVSTEPPESMVRALVGDFEQRVGRVPTPEETEQLKAEWSAACGDDAHLATLTGIDEPIFCLGNCALGPAALVDGELLGRADVARLKAAVSVAQAAGEGA